SLEPTSSNAKLAKAFHRNISLLSLSRRGAARVVRAKAKHQRREQLFFRRDATFLECDIGLEQGIQGTVERLTTPAIGCTRPNSGGRSPGTAGKRARFSKEFEVLLTEPTPR